MAAPVADIASAQQLDALAASAPAVVLHFWAPWSEPCKHMDIVFGELAKRHPGARFARVEAEEVDAVTERFGVSSVPTFVITKGGKALETIEGADPAALTAKVEQHAGGAAAAPAPAAAPAVAAVPAAALTPEVVARIKKLLGDNAVMLFMKGSPQEPRCGFSRRVAEALDAEGIKFGSFDILQDEAIRQGLKEFSNWPTYPQLYVKGELLGGCDIVTELAQSKELKSTIESMGGTGAETAQEDVPTRCRRLIDSHDVMLFMKGSPQEPRCGFSRQVADALSSEGIKFGSFDILQDEAVRQGLKELSNWPTYPQLYVKGELLGGCDIVLELKADAELKNTVDEMLFRT